MNTAECWNPNVRNPNNAKIQTFLCSFSRGSDFRHLGCSVFSIVLFDLLCIEPNKNRWVLYHSLVFRQKKRPKSKQICSDFRRCPKSERFSIVRNPNLFGFQHSTVFGFKTKIPPTIPNKRPKTEFFGKMCPGFGGFPYSDARFSDNHCIKIVMKKENI